MRNNRGVTAVSAVLTTLILILIVFLLYEIFYVDLFNIMGTRALKTEELNNIKQSATLNIDNENKIINVINYTPIDNSNLERK